MADTHMSFRRERYWFMEYLYNPWPSQQLREREPELQRHAKREREQKQKPPLDRKGKQE